MSSARSCWHAWSTRTPSHAPRPGCERTLVAPPSRAAARACLMTDGTITGLCLPGLRAPHRFLRLADDERAPLRSLRPAGVRQPLPQDARPSGATDLGVATTGEADGRGPRRTPRLDLPRLASRATSGPTRQARGRPSGAARPRWRAAAGTARRPLLKLLCAQGPEPAEEVRAACALAELHQPQHEERAWHVGQTRPDITW